MKNIFKKIHLWLSIPVGLIVSLICITGAILVFETELSETFNSSRYFVNEVKGEPLTLDVLLEKVQKELPDSASIASVQVPSEMHKTYRIGLDRPARSSVYVNPYTAEIVDKEYDAQGSFFAKVRALHRWLLLQGDSRSVGKNIVGISTLIFVIILISGIIVWLPNRKSVLKRRLKIRFRKGWRRFWYDFHLAAGIYVAIILLVLALTGLTWSFGWYRSAFYGLFGVEAPQGGGGHQNRAGNQQRGEGRKGGDESKRTTDFSKWQVSLADVQNQLSEYKSITIQKGTASASIDVFGNSRASNNYKLDKKTGKVTETDLYTDRNKSGKLRGWIYSVHTGSWGGMLTKILTFFASLVGGILPISGYYLYLKRTIKKKNK